MLATVLVEDETPTDEFWSGRLLASRLIQYEVWTRIHARGATRTHGDTTQLLLDRIDLLELAAPLLTRALDPFPQPVRTLDALHLATIEFLRAQGEAIELATYDRRMREAARTLGIPLYRL